MKALGQLHAFEGKIIGPWKDDFPAMNMKTALRKVSKYTPTAPATEMLHRYVRFDEMQETGAIDVKPKATIKQPTALPDGQKMSDLKDQIEVMGAKAEGEAVDPDAPYGRDELTGDALPLFPEEGGPPLEDKI